MRDERITESRFNRGHLTLVHSRPEDRGVQRRSIRARAWASASTAIKPPRRAGLDPAVYSQALGDLIIAAGGKVPGRVVFAPAAGTLDAGRFVADLAAHSRRIGLAVLAAEITGAAGRTGLRWCEAPGIDDAEADPLALDLFNPRWPEDFASWRARTARFADMVLVAGPALDRSVDAALVGSAFEGVVLLAHRGVTSRTAIDDAARRCRSVEANLYGVAFIDGAVPSWQRHPMAARPQVPSRS
jgi:hypothetical protein